MSKEAVELVLGKALLDADFRQALLANPDRALSRFDLSEAEKAGLRRVDCETLECLAGVLKARKDQIRLKYGRKTIFSI